MKRSYMIALALIVISCLAACDKPTGSAVSSNAPASDSKAADPALEKLQQYSGANATNCGRLAMSASQTDLKAASDCAMQANQSKHPFFVAYDMPGMTVGVAGNSDAKLFTVQSHGPGSVEATGDDCPSQLRVASSGRVTCFAPGDMGSMGASHSGAQVPPGTPNPHEAAPSK